MNALTDSPDEAALRRAALAAPEDDLPRLVYADWLDENGGHARAEFIRHACEGAGRGRPASPEGGSGPGRPHARARELLAAHARDWFALPGLGPPEFADDPAAPPAELLLRWRDGDDRGAPVAAEGRVSRGFLTEFRCPFWRFVDGTECAACSGGVYWEPAPGCAACGGAGGSRGVAAALLAAHPVRTVGLTDREPVARAADGPGSPGRWGWHRPGGRLGPGDLPPDLYALLPPEPGDPPESEWRWFASRELAMHALSDACVRYGRGVSP